MAEQLDSQAAVVSPVNVQEFSKKVKEKYPEYKDVDDVTLAKKIVEKYPEYKDKVQFDPPKPQQTGTQPTTEPGQPVISASESLHSSLPYVHIDENNPNNNQAVQSIPDTKKDVSFDENAAPKVGDETKVQNVIPQTKAPEEEYFNPAIQNTGGAKINSNQPKESIFFSSPEEEKMDLAKNILDRSKRQVDAVTGQGDNTGVGDALRDRNFWTLGATDLSSMIYLKKIAGKIEDGTPLTNGDKALLEAWNQSEQVNQQYPSSEANIWYKTGKNVTDMIPWLVQFAATRGAGSAVTKGIQSTLKQNAEKYLGKTIASGLSKGVAEVAGAYAAAASMPNTYADITRRTLGQTYQDEQGNIKFDVSEADSNAKAIYKGWTNGMLEVLTERIGEGITEGIKYLPKNRLTSLLTGQAKGKTGKAISDFTKAVGWNGAPLEYFEEWVNVPLNALLVGDNKYSDMFDGKQQLETFLTVAAMGSAMSTTQLAANKYDAYKVNKEYKSAKSLFENEIDEPTRKAVDLIANSDLSIADQSNQLDQLLSRVDGEQAGIIMNYVIQSIKKNSYRQQPVTTATIEGQQYTINNPEDLGQEGKPIFAKDANGNVVPVQNHKVANPVTKTVEQIDQENQQVAERAKLYEGISDPNSKSTIDFEGNTTDENGNVTGNLKVIDFSNGQTKIIFNDQEIIANDANEKDRILESITNENKLPEPKATEIGEVISPEPEKKVVTQKFGNTSIDIIENEGYDEVVPSEKVPLEKALTALEKKFKDNEDFELQVEKVQVEEPGETKYDKPVKKTVIKSIRIVPKVTQNANIEDAILNKVTETQQQLTDQQNVENIQSVESSQKNQLQNEKPLESSSVDSNELGQNANQGENTPQAQQGQGNEKGLEENVSDKSLWELAKDWNIKKSNKESTDFIESAISNKLKNASDESLNYTLNELKQLNKTRGNDDTRTMAISLVESEIKNRNTVSQVATISQTPGDSAPLINETTKINQVPDAGKLIEQEKANAKKAKQQAKQISPEEQKQRKIDRAKALSIEPSTIEQLVLQYVVSGNRLNWDEIKREIFPRSDSEMKQRIWMLKKDGKTIDDLLGLLNGTSMEEEGNQSNVFRNAVIDAVLRNGTRTQMVDRILEIGDQNQKIESLSDYELGEALQAQEIAEQQLIDAEWENKFESIEDFDINELFLQDYERPDNQAEVNKAEVQRIGEPISEGNRQDGTGSRKGTEPISQSEVGTGPAKELTPLEKEIQALQSERTELISKKSKTVKNVNARNGLFGDIAAQPGDLFAGQGFDATEAQKIVKSIDDRISVIDQTIEDLTVKNEQVKATAEKENSGQQEINIPDVSLESDQVQDVAGQDSGQRPVVNQRENRIRKTKAGWSLDEKITDEDLKEFPSLPIVKDDNGDIWSPVMTSKSKQELTDYLNKKQSVVKENLSTETPQKVSFTYLDGSEVTGIVIGESEDDKLRIKGDDGFVYRMPKDKVSDARLRVTEKEGSLLNVSEKAAQDIEGRPNLVKTLDKISSETNVPVNLINSTEIPKRIQREANKDTKNQKSGGNVIFAYYDFGEVYIVSDKIQSVSSAVGSYLHETIIHKGLRNTFAQSDQTSIIGKQYAKLDDLFIDVFGSMSRSQKMQIANYYAPGLYENGRLMRNPTNEEKALIGEEFLAHISENPEIYDAPVLSKWKEWINRLAQIIRKAFRLTSNQFSQNDLLDIIREQRRRMGEQSKVDADENTRLRIIGETGAANLDKAEEATTRLDNLAIAREMEQAGKDVKSIRLATGWEKGVDGKWRYEVPDIELKKSFADIINQVRNTEDKSLPLSQVIEDENLFKEYPKLKDTKILFYATGSNNVTAFANNTENVIGITVTTPEYEAYRLGGAKKSTPIRAYSNDSFKSVLSHEIQHIIQSIEGFGRGGNPETVFNSIVEDRIRQLQEISGRDTISESEREEIEREVRREYETSYGAYQRLVGEVESRNVQTRMNMTPEERLNTLLSETEDVSREDQIVLMDGLRISNLENLSLGENKPMEYLKSKDVETGKPVTMTYLRNTEKAPYLGSRFGQDVEPSGFYFIQKEHEFPPSKGWIEGQITLNNPLVIPITDETMISYKNDLSKKYGGKKNKALTNAIKKDGYDGIITTRDGYLGEMIKFDFDPSKQAEEPITDKIEQQRSEVNTEPSEAQKEAGNYKMGHIRFDGFDISIENPKGSVRSGVDKQGNEWSQVLPADYGYFRGTVGKDKDHVDVFIGNKPEASNIYIIDQIDPNSGKFDEHKVMLGFDSQAKAKQTYLAAFEPGWKGLGQITKTDKQGLKEWFEKGDQKKPFSDNPNSRFRIAPRDERIDQLREDLNKVSRFRTTSENDLLKSVNETVESNMNESYGIKQTPLWERIKKKLSEVKESTQHFKYITEKDFPEVYDKLRQFEAIPDRVKKEAFERVSQIVRPLIKNEEHMRAFERYIVLSDLVHDIEETDLFAGKELPWGYNTVDEIKQDMRNVRAYVMRTPQVLKAIRDRQAMMKEVKKELVANKLLKDNGNNNYFHHQVLAFMEGRANVGVSAKDVRNHKKGWQRSRQGSIALYNTNYVESEFEVMAQSLEQLAIKDMLGEINESINIMPQLIEKAQKEGGKWRDYIPDGYKFWFPKPGTNAYKAASMAEKAVQNLMNDPENPELQAILAEAEGSMWVIPEPVAKQLDEMKDREKEMVYAEALRAMTGKWKQWTLLNPFRAAKYNFNNLSGDLDIVLAYNPKILEKKYAHSAMTEALNELRGLGMSPDMKEALKYGVITSGLSIQEIPDINKQSLFRSVTKGQGTWAKRMFGKTLGSYWSGVTAFTQFRENILRVAAYKFFKDQIRQGKQPIGVSKIDAIQALYASKANANEIAGKLARELMGDYGNLSQGGQWIRAHSYPFWSWVEVNAPRYYRLLQNTKFEGNSGVIGRVAGVGAKKTAVNMGMLGVRVMLMTGLVMLWNQIMFPDEDDELQKYGDDKLKLIVGRREDGSIITIKIQGAFSDVLSFFSLEDAVSDAKELKEGKTTAGKKLAESGNAFVNKFVQGAMPLTRASMELAMGKSLYPDIFDPRVIRDRGEHAARLVSMDKLYNYLTHKPVRSYGKEVSSLLVYDNNPGEAAYYTMREKINEFLKDNDEDGPAMEPSDKSNALYYYKKSLKMGDQKAAKFWFDKYRELGGTAQGYKTSMKKGMLMNAVPKDLRAKWFDGLDAEDKEILDLANRWYMETYLKVGIPVKKNE